MAFTSSLTTTDDQQASAVPLEPAFENLLRASIVHKRSDEITDRPTFRALDSTEEGLKTSALGLGIDLRAPSGRGGIKPMREVALLITA